jgi:hypothetical protein
MGCAFDGEAAGVAGCGARRHTRRAGDRAGLIFAGIGSGPWILVGRDSGNEGQDRQRTTSSRRRSRVDFGEGRLVFSTGLDVDSGENIVDFSEHDF